MDLDCGKKLERETKFKGGGALGTGYRGRSLALGSDSTSDIPYDPLNPIGSDPGEQS